MVTDFPAVLPLHGRPSASPHLPTSSLHFPSSLPTTTSPPLMFRAAFEWQVHSVLLVGGAMDEGHGDVDFLH